MNVINLRGRKPQTIPDGAVYIGGAVKRGGWNLEASKWANPYRITKGLVTRDQAIERYGGQPIASGLIRDIHELRGKPLACWCAPLRCHGDLLIAFAEAPHIGGTA